MIGKTLAERIYRFFVLYDPFSYWGCSMSDAVESIQKTPPAKMIKILRSYYDPEVPALIRDLETI